MNIRTILLVTSFVAVTALEACDKVDVVFQNESADADPNITYLENTQIALSTFKLDSFKTSGNSTFMVGTHNDTNFAKITASSYAEIVIPAENPLPGQNIEFDSIVMVLKPTGNYYGDTTLPFKLSVHRVIQKIDNEDTTNNTFYYPMAFPYEIDELGSTTTYVKPTRKKEVTIRLADELGIDWLKKMKEQNTIFSNQENFRAYFPGVVIRSDSMSNNALYYFNSDDSTVLIRLYYRLRTTQTTSKYLNFRFRSEKQYNNIVYNKTNTPFKIYRQYKREIYESAQMNNRAYISNNMPSYAKITFPNLVSLKEAHPYIRILKAELQIHPAPGTFQYPYSLPDSLVVAISNSDNLFSSNLQNSDGSLQTGNLTVDKLNGAEPTYTFDITSYINTVLSEGVFSTKALFLGSSESSGDQASKRLIINDQIISSSGIKLKLYVLGL